MSESPRIDDVKAMDGSKMPESSIPATQEVSLHDGTTENSPSLSAQRRLVRRLDCTLLVLLVAGFFVLQLDRNNISNALTDTLTEDLGITSDEVNLGNQLQLIGIIIAEIPSNLVLQRTGASVWLTAQVLLWGSIALGQTWITNKGSFYATRFLLGIFEAGYIPSAQYMLALFYTREELALRTAIFLFGNYLASATGSLIAAGVLQMGGLQGLAGWRWLFLLEGTITLCMVPLFVFFLPNSPAHTRPLLGPFDLFTTEDREVMSTRGVASPNAPDSRADMSKATVIEALLDYRLWMHMCLNIVAIEPKGGLQLYGPTVIRSLGFSKINANLLSAVSSFLVIILSFLISFASDKTGWRGPWCIVAFSWSIIFSGSLYGSVTGPKWVKYALFTFLSGGNALAQGLNDAWLSINARSRTSRSIGLALVVMGSNLGGLSGQQLFRSSDAPLYQNAFASIMALYAASIVLTLLIMAVYWRARRSDKLHGRDSETARVQL